jgi:hypothetical protein
LPSKDDPKYGSPSFEIFWRVSLRFVGVKKKRIYEIIEKKTTTL